MQDWKYMNVRIVELIFTENVKRKFSMMFEDLFLNGQTFQKPFHSCLLKRNQAFLGVLMKQVNL